MTVNTGDVFLSATDVVNNTFNFLILHREARQIEYDILLAANSGLFNVNVSNSYMTDTTLPPVQNVISINLSSSQFTITNHGFTQGQLVTTNSTGSLPAPLIAGNMYYVIVIDANTFQLANTQQDIIFNNPIILTDGAQTIATGTVANPTFTPATQITINSSTVSITGTNLAQTIIDINNAAIPNIIASQGNNNNLVITDTIGDALTISGAAATAAGLPPSTPAPVMTVQEVSIAQQFYNTWQGISTNAPQTYLMQQVIAHFVNLGYNITQQQNPQVNSVFWWVVSW